MAKLSSRKGPVKVAQRNRSERYTENRFSSDDGRTTTANVPLDCMSLNEQHIINVNGAVMSDVFTIPITLSGHS